MGLEQGAVKIESSANSRTLILKLQIIIIPLFNSQCQNSPTVKAQRSLAPSEQEMTNSKISSREINMLKSQLSESVFLEVLRQPFRPNG